MEMHWEAEQQAMLPEEAARVTARPRGHGMGAAALGLRELVLNGSEGKIMLVIKCGAIGVVGLAVYVAMCYLLRLRELTDVLKKRKKG